MNETVKNSTKDIKKMSEKFEKDRAVAKVFELEVIDGVELLYFPVRRGAHKGLYFYIYDIEELKIPLSDETIFYPTPEKIKKLIARLRSEGYAAGYGYSKASADDALSDYMRGREPQ